MRRVDNFFEYYEWTKALGGGQFGEVNQARNKKANMSVAVKICKKDRIERDAEMTALLK